MWHAKKYFGTNRIGTGQYVHFGLMTVLKEFLVLNQSSLNVNVYQLLIDINIDGVPISNSSNACLWPILVNVVGFQAVLCVGIYFGPEKPTDINQYMGPFVEDYCAVYTTVALYLVLEYLKSESDA